jgi:hypothetical protein
LPTIALDRRFSEWRAGDISDPDLVLRFMRSADLLTWENLLARRRVVILAEAGSGKTEEMREQLRLATENGRFAFFATVEDVDRDGLDGALSAADRDRPVRWRASVEEAWFFIDSIDEATVSSAATINDLRACGNDRAIMAASWGEPSARLTDRISNPASW